MANIDDDSKKIQRELVRKINDAFNLIAKRQRTGDANYIILNSKATEVYKSAIDTMAEFQINEDRLKKLNDIFGEIE
jgi:hypothetical protein